MNEDMCVWIIYIVNAFVMCVADQVDDHVLAYQCIGFRSTKTWIEGLYACPWCEILLVISTIGKSYQLPFLLVFLLQGI